ncbi:BlaI/MecI/CopY family transcriptional regulator [Lachnospiraceae bacterium NSJ-143]|nr:BlaI/MecI/CopY family transcriptional regulator [Lachnospiraceae bacterium NSJ-143]
MKSEIKISEAEYEIMMVIWEFSPISTNEVVDKLDGKNDWSPKTIQTLLSRLVKKGALAVTKRSREFVYTPQIKKSDYVSGESENFLKKFYNGTLNSMVMNFLEEDKLTDDDIAELKRILDKRL